MWRANAKLALSTAIESKSTLPDKSQFPTPINMSDPRGGPPPAAACVSIKTIPSVVPLNWVAVLRGHAERPIPSVTAKLTKTTFSPSANAEGRPVPAGLRGLTKTERRPWRGGALA